MGCMAGKLAKALAIIGTLFLWIYGYIIVNSLLFPKPVGTGTGWGALGAALAIAALVIAAGLFLGLPGLILILVSYILVRKEGSKLVGALLAFNGLGALIISLALLSKAASAETLKFLIIPLLIALGIIYLGIKAFRKKPTEIT